MLVKKYVLLILIVDLDNTVMTNKKFVYNVDHNVINVLVNQIVKFVLVVMPLIKIKKCVFLNVLLQANVNLVNTVINNLFAFHVPKIVINVQAHKCVMNAKLDISLKIHYKKCVYNNVILKLIVLMEHSVIIINVLLV